MSSFVDASMIVCHLTGEPPDSREVARRVFAGDDPCFVSDVTVADAVEILDAGFSVDRHLIATAIRSLLARENVACVDAPVLLRAIGIYELDDVRFPAAHVVALAESTGIDRVSSLDAAIDRVRTVRRVGR